jgi:hypothetical protein
MKLKSFFGWMKSIRLFDLDRSRRPAASVHLAPSPQDPEFKRLAALVLADGERVDVLTQLVAHLLEQAADAGALPRPNAMRSLLEQQSACLEAAQKARETLRLAWGVDGTV